MIRSRIIYQAHSKNFDDISGDIFEGSDPDPCYCSCCIFTAEVLLTPMGGVPLLIAHKRDENKALGNGDIDSNDGENDHNDEQGVDWMLTMASIITGNVSDDNNSDSGDSNGSSGHHDGDDEDGGDGWDGGTD